MSALVFVDTNVLVYARDTRVPHKQRSAHEWLDFLWETRRGRLSPQVLNEYYVTVTRKLKPGLPVEEARTSVRDLYYWLGPVDAQDLLEAAWTLEDRASISFWDALVVGAARSMGCMYVLTEDLSARQDLGGVRVVDPFAGSPRDLDG